MIKILYILILALAPTILTHILHYNFFFNHSSIKETTKVKLGVVLTVFGFEEDSDLGKYWVRVLLRVCAIWVFCFFFFGSQLMELCWFV